MICFFKSVKHLTSRCFRTNSKKRYGDPIAFFDIGGNCTVSGGGSAHWGGSPYHACRSSKWVAAGKRHLPLRAQRALKGRWEIDKREETDGFLPLARSAAAQAAFQPVKSWHTRLPCWANRPRRAGANSTHLGSGHAAHHTSVTYCCGSTFSSFTCISKWTCGPVELPVLPESAIWSPWATISPTETSSSELCAYNVL